MKTQTTFPDRSKNTRPLLIFLTLLVAGNSSFSQMNSPERLSVKAETFPYGDVRLLPGPFLDALDRTSLFLLTIDPDRLLHTFRLNARIPTEATPFGGWEAPDVELRGHSLGHYLTACALTYANTGDQRFKEKGDYIVEELFKVQMALHANGSNDGYLSAFPEEFIDRVESRKRVWAPYYTLHKIMAGLLDMYVHCGNRDALDVLRRMADWALFRMERLTHTQQQAMLQTEFGGMNDVLAELHAATGEQKYLHLARMFDHEAVFAPLASGVDSLDGLHGNTQIPKAIGALREFELTGERRYYDIARFFWERVVSARSYVIGGNTNDEHFFPVDQFAFNLGSASTETCNSYNMLKLTKGLFSHDVSASFMDYYERTLYNHILASQDPSTGMMCYYVPLKPGAYKTFSTPDSSFWCCVGTGLENPPRYVESIYFHDQHSLWVNLFIASEVSWTSKGIIVRQETSFPEEGSTKLTINLQRPSRFKLHVRNPVWARRGMTIKVNGVSASFPKAANGYIDLERDWNSGDVVDVSLPMSLSTEPLPGNEQIVAVLYGPIVLAGELGKIDAENTREYGPYAPAMRASSPLAVPAFVLAEGESVVGHIEPATASGLIFKTKGLGRPTDVTLLPFYQSYHIRYNVYWQVYGPDAWRRSEQEAQKRRSYWQDVVQKTVDVVDIEQRDAEKAHSFRGEHVGEHWYDDRRGRESKGGWFSYRLAIDTLASTGLVCVFRGSEGRDRRFSISVNGVHIAEESLMRDRPDFVIREYAVPGHLSDGRDSLSVSFKPLEGAIAGPLFELRTTRKEAQ